MLRRVSEALLEVRRAHVRLAGRAVLSGIDLAIAGGEMLAIAGPNGAGKTTLLRAITGVVALASGSVEVRGHALASLSRRAIARDIAYLPQETWTEFGLLVRDVVALGRYAHRGAFGALRNDDVRAIRDAMEQADVAHLEGRLIPELSGGERRRVMLARALAQGARVLVLDEPTTALDIGHACATMDLLARMAAEGRAVLFTVHDLTLALRGTTRAALLVDGRIVADGDPATVLTGSAARDAFRVPLTRVGPPDAIVPAS